MFSDGIAWLHEHWRGLLTAIEVIWLVWLSVFVLLEQRSPVSTLAWILGLAALPIVGVVIYYTAGPRRLERRRVRRRGARQVVGRLNASRDAAAQLIRPQQRPLIELLRNLEAAAPEPASSVKIYSEGDDFYDALVADIEKAQRHVHVEFYIFAADRSGTRIRDALIERAMAGVEVRLLVDSLGTGGMPRHFRKPIEKAGIHLAIFNSPRFRLLARSIMNFRSHRKIVVIDGQIGFTGGINVIDDHSAAANGSEAWRDTQVRIEGNAVHALQRTFLEDWLYATKHRSPKNVKPLDYFPFVECEQFEAVQVLASGPDQERNASEAAYLDAISRAEQRIWITTPYFVPPDPILAMLSNAAQRGVDVRLLLPKKTDNRLVDAATRTWWNRLIERGVKIYAYQPRMVHAKTAVIDDWLGIVGSANIDYRSLRLNFEVGALLYGPESIEKLAQLFLNDLQQSKVVQITRPTFFPRLFQSAARVLSPQL